MQGLEIIIICATAAYIAMKLREYIKSANELKTSLANAKQIENTKKNYQDQIKQVEAQIDKFQDKLAVLSIDPITRDTRRKAKKLEKRISKLIQAEKEYQTALADFEIISSSKEHKISENKLRKTLKSYLNDKGRL